MHLGQSPEEALINGEKRLARGRRTEEWAGRVMKASLFLGHIIHTSYVRIAIGMGIRVGGNKRSLSNGTTIGISVKNLGEMDNDIF